MKLCLALTGAALALVLAATATAAAPKRLTALDAQTALVNHFARFNPYHIKCTPRTTTSWECTWFYVDTHRPPWIDANMARISPGPYAWPHGIYSIVSEDAYGRLHVGSLGG